MVLALPALHPRAGEIAKLEDVRVVRLPDGNGIDLCRELLAVHDELRCLILTSFTDDRTYGSWNEVRVSTVRELTQVLLEHKIGALPVLDGEHLVGIVTETDVLRAFARSQH